MRPHGVLEVKNAFVKSAYSVMTVCTACRLYFNLRAIFTDRRRSQWPRGLRRAACCRSPAEIVGSNPTGGHGCVSVVSVVCCQVEVSATS